MNQPELPLSNSKDLITAHDGELYADSRIVAVGFGIEHHSLAKSLSQHFTDLKSVNPSQSGVAGGRPVRAYLLTERQVMMLPAICSVTPQLKAFQARLVDAFLAYRSRDVQGPLNADQVIAIGQRMKELEDKVAVLEPKAESFERLATAEGTYGMDEAATVLGVGRTRLFEWCRSNRHIEPKPGRKPYQKSIESGWFVVRMKVCGDGESRIVPLVTQAGVIYISKKMGVTPDWSKVGVS